MGGPTFGFKHIALVASARVYYHCHYVGDTIAGCVIGLILGYLYYNFETNVLCDWLAMQAINIFVSRTLSLDFLHKTLINLLIAMCGYI